MNFKDKLSRIEKIYAEKSKLLLTGDENHNIIKKSDILSNYGFDSVDEFISECVAEYLTVTHEKHQILLWGF